VHDVGSAKLRTAAELLTPLFYFLMFLALVAALSGSAGSALVVLLLGATAHVVRAALEELRLRA
jgi:membrane protein implicated in regulation of membrane protease activity